MRQLALALGGWAARLMHPRHEVPDPWYGGPDGFEEVYEMLDMACEKLLNELQHGR